MFKQIFACKTASLFSSLTPWGPFNYVSSRQRNGLHKLWLGLQRGLSGFSFFNQGLHWDLFLCCVSGLFLLLVAETVKGLNFILWVEWSECFHSGSSYGQCQWERRWRRDFWNVWLWRGIWAKTFGQCTEWKQPPAGAFSSVFSSRPLGAPIESLPCPSGQ